MATCDVNNLMLDARCFAGLEPRQLAAVHLQLLCNLQSEVETLITNMAVLCPCDTHGVLEYAATVDVDFDGDDYQTVTLAGNIDFATSSNRSDPACAVIHIIGDGSDRTLAFNANWIFVTAKPTTIAANKVGILSLTCLGTGEADIVAAYTVQS